MKVELLTVADYASLSKEDKLSIIGIFSVINTPDMPSLHPSMYVVFQVVVDEGEVGSKHSLSITITGPDGKVVQSVDGDVDIPSDLTQPRLNGMVNITGLVFQMEGDYSVSLVFDRTTIASTGFKVKQIGTKANA